MVSVKVKKDLIHKYRVQLGLSQQDLSTKAGISRQFLSEIEKGAKNPSLVTLARLAAALGVETTDLYEEIL